MAWNYFYSFFSSPFYSTSICWIWAYSVGIEVAIEMSRLSILRCNSPLTHLIAKWTLIVAQWLLFVNPKRILIAYPFHNAFKHCPGRQFPLCYLSYTLLHTFIIRQKLISFRYPLVEWNEIIYYWFYNAISFLCAQQFQTHSHCNNYEIYFFHFILLLINLIIKINYEKYYFWYKISFFLGKLEMMRRGGKGGGRIMKLVYMAKKGCGYMLSVCPSVHLSVRWTFRTVVMIISHEWR